MVFSFAAVDELSCHILKSDDAVGADGFVAQSITFMGCRAKFYVDDGDISERYTQRREAGGEPYLAACERLCTMHLRVSSRNWPCQLRERSSSPSSFSIPNTVSLIHRWL